MHAQVKIKKPGRFIIHKITPNHLTLIYYFCFLYKNKPEIFSQKSKIHVCQ